jgi:putative heme-binding domain-containing protein
MDMEPKEKDQLIQDAMATGNLYRGQILYRKKELLCTTCHRVNSMGGLSGPDLSTIGTFMTPPAILDAVLNPTNDIKQGFETVILTKNDGEIVSGLLDRKTDKATLIRMANSEIVAIPASEIANIDVSPVSLMPTGLTRNLHKDELKDLLAYLMSLGVN